MNRSFWTAATSSGIVVNSPVKKWFSKNDAETIFERLEQHGKTWKIYVMEPMRLSFHGIIHYSRLKDRLATNVVPFAEFEKDAAAGTLPDFSLIEPNFISGHGDYHPAFGRSLGVTVDASTLDPPSSVLGGEAFLARIFNSLPLQHRGVGLERLEHRSADRLGRAGRHLRPRAPGTGPAARPRRPGRRARLQVRSLRLPRSRDPRLPLGPARLGVQRRVPPYLADRHPARRPGSSASHSPSATPQRARSTTSSPSTSRAIRRPGRPSPPLPVPSWHLDEEALSKGAQRPRQEHGTGLRRARAGAGTRASAGS